jgi:hypothetical protein
VSRGLSSFGTPDEVEEKNLQLNLHSKRKLLPELAAMVFERMPRFKKKNSLKRKGGGGKKREEA